MCEQNSVQIIRNISRKAGVVGTTSNLVVGFSLEKFKYF